MWPFKRRKVCNHPVWKPVGYFYKESLSEWRNCFDRVYAYIRYKCTNCGECKNLLLGSKEYVPELYHGRDPQKDEYIKSLQSLGYMSEVQISMLHHKINNEVCNG